jgi:lysophospholipase
MWGTELYRRQWVVQSAKSIVVLVHGQGEHCGRYEYAATALNDQGYDVYSGDLPGHGRSGGLRGHIDRFDDYVGAVADWVNEAIRRSEGRPVFLLGHSVGGLIVVRYLETKTAAAARLAGVVLSGPALKLRYPIPSWKEALGRRLNGVFPKLRLPSGLKQQRVTRSEDVQLATAVDPLMVYVASIRFYNELLYAQAEAVAGADRIRLPLLLLHGGADEVIEPAVSLEFGQRIASEDKDVRILPDLHHEIINEPERDEVLREMIHWMDHRVIAAK